MSGHLDPSLTDDEIIATFTPDERRLHAWYENGGMDQFRSGGLIRGLEAMYPDIEDVDETLMTFSDKWLDRNSRRNMMPVSRSSLLTRIRETSCRDPQHLLQTILSIQMGNIPDLLVGESRFGGTLTGYIITVNPRAFHPDEPFDEINDADNAITLDPAIVAIDIDTISSQQSSLPDATPPLSPAQKRRRENRNSGDESLVSVRSANSDDFLDTEPDVFYQVGKLMSCAGVDWMKIRDKPIREILRDTKWEHTGYSVVVKLNRNGYPTGPVFAIFAFSHLASTMDGLEVKEIEWRDHLRQELPHVRSLYSGCDKKFFLAQMAEKLENLDHGVEFDFAIKAENKGPVQRTKVVGFGPSRKIIPFEVFPATGSSEDKRFRMTLIDDSD
ncbi:unnamed protein product [Clonostachys chloroleuca]|uniref:Uncharacterized protein n=1 Tax=Clonostachys chloroleuca TaxID=1926264 RepID=A0AA35Q7S2_9HYPO|nr:unnamed protein product [Clonostachys chloroleuca]